jgi:hypothetical protein
MGNRDRLIPSEEKGVPEIPHGKAAGNGSWSGKIWVTSINDLFFHGGY